MTDKILYVPVMLEGLVIGKNNSKLADLTQKYNHINGNISPPLSAGIMNSVYTIVEEKPGVHLHWTLPDALLHGTQDNDGKLIFPRLPNRWVVQRISLSGTAPVWKAWVIESDFCSTQESLTTEGMYKVTAPAFKFDSAAGLWKGAGSKGEKHFYLGDARPFGSEPPANGAYLDTLTAVGLGDHLFTAYYPKSKTVFGFYDSMENAKSGDYTYVLAGYYANENHDPLFGGDQKKLAELLWKIKDAKWEPDTAICHSILTGIAWKGKDAEYDFGAPMGDIKVGLASTSAEAMSMIVQQRMPESANLARVLNALQYGALKELDNPADPDALINFEELLHEKQFFAVGVEVVWVFRKANEAIEDQRLTEALYTWISELNSRQRELNRLNDTVASLRQEVYSLWAKYVTKYFSPNSQAGDAANDLSGTPLAEMLAAQDGNAPEFYLEQVNERLELLEASLEAVKKLGEKTERMAADKALNKALAEKNKELVKTTRGQSYTAADPVIALYGDGLERAFKSGFQSDPSGMLPCRMELLTSITVTIDKKTCTLNVDDILNSLLKNTGATFAQLPQPMKSLLVEAFLLCPGFADYLATRIYEKQNITPTPKQLTSAADSVRGAQARPECFSGTMPYFPVAMTVWKKQPWSPLLMAWTIEIQPIRSIGGVDDSLNYFALDEIDFIYNEKKPSPQKIEMQNATLLTPHAAFHLQNALGKLIEDYGVEGAQYKELKKAIEQVAQMQVLTQRMDGFSDMLVMCDNFPMLPVCSISPTSAQTARKLTAYIEGVMKSPRLRIEASTYLPMRAGLMTVSRFWLIDSFGQIKKVIDSDAKLSSTVSVAESLATDGRSAPALLRPRFPQPCELRFDWLRHDDESQETADEATSPIFGYLSPNFLDLSLFVYDSTGALLGFVQLGSQGTKWLCAPNGNIRTPEQILNGHLRQFVMQMLGTKGSPAKEFLVYLDKHYNNALASPTDSFLQLCFGKAIALARARITVDAKGNPRCAQIWQNATECMGYPLQSFKVKIGDSRKLRDGTVGFFPDKNAAPDYSEMKICPISDFVATGYLKPDNQISLSLTQNTQKMTVLFDPSSYITLRTGFLPAKRVELHADFYRNQLEQMDIAFRLAPLLSPPEMFEVCLPGGDFEWTFSYVNKAREPAQSDEIAPPPVLPPAGRVQAFEGFLKSTRQKGAIE